MYKLLNDCLYLLFENHTTWIKPSIQEEMEEIKRTAEELHMPLRALLLAAQRGSLVVLDDVFWSQMENTDSWETTDMDIVEKLGTEYERDVDGLVQAMKTGQTLPAPLVLLKPNGIPYLIGGNTRLMVARALGIRPKVFLIKLSS
jgi:hypothetical protein